ncbi:Putative Transfer complex protein TraH [Staphylococcus aureus]|uniref:hypothetical protein n=1 Tax=Staphylococcus aureus TaxID=1280 RepID=UPI000DFAB42A|nr:hypothetical protein [Staphylococcus aureus]SUM53440.1 Putative Transfer complex protein TraH [Staphylococcus aureus]
MKKLLTIVILFTLVLAGCGQNQSEKNSEKHNEEKTVDTTEERNDMIKGLIDMVMKMMIIKVISI